MSRSWLIALTIMILAGLWMASGLMGSAAVTDGEEATAEVEEKLPRVRVATFEADDAVRQLSIQGRTQADKMVVISAETDGRLNEITVDRGDVIEAGQLLISIDEEDRRDRLAEAKALLAQRQLEFDAANKLNQSGFQSQVRLAQSQAELQAARSEVEQAGIELSRTSVQAPIDGIVLRRMAEVGSFAQRGDDMLEIVDLDPIKVLGSVPEAEVNAIKLGQPAVLEVVGLEPIQGEVSYIAPQAAEQTRTFEIEIQVPNAEGEVRAGLTAAIVLPISGQKTHRLPASILSLDSNGSLGVKGLDDQNRVVFMPVELVDDSPSGIWVAGLQDKVRLITVGQEYVREGQQVEPTNQPFPGQQNNGSADQTAPSNQAAEAVGGAE
ncbi:MAG: efflux RND transporter periplasmic adaptor subunit [Alphaproteobacteria bacterium]|nr:efflux RND transporter periplasmic adaptor subunit [Alphaproteobacteria bacterium SS10]